MTVMNMIMMMIMMMIMTMIFMMTMIIMMYFLHPKGPNTRLAPGGEAINYDDNDDDDEVFSKNLLFV